MFDAHTITTLGQNEYLLVAVSDTLPLSPPPDGGGGLQVELVVVEIDTFCVVEIDLVTCSVVVWLPLTPTPLYTLYLPPPLTRAVLRMKNVVVVTLLLQTVHQLDNI